MYYGTYYVGCNLFLFFQAEDGIRDRVRSRGLGDVYKRQARTLYHIWWDSWGLLGTALGLVALLDHFLISRYNMLQVRYP